jgi:hypothetical protein
MKGILWDYETKGWIIRYEHLATYGSTEDDIKVHPDDLDEISKRRVYSGAIVEFKLTPVKYPNGESKLYGKITWSKRDSLSESIKTQEQADQFMNLLQAPSFKRENAILKKENADLKLANEVMTNHIEWLHKVGKIDTSRLQEDPIERLRNKLQSFVTLPELIRLEAGDKAIKEQSELCFSLIPDIKKYLSDLELLVKS